MCHDHDFWQAFAYFTNNSIGAIVLDYLAINAPRLQSALYKRGALLEGISPLLGHLQSEMKPGWKVNLRHPKCNTPIYIFPFNYTLEQEA